MPPYLMKHGARMMCRSDPFQVLNSGRLMQAPLQNVLEHHAFDSARR